MSFLELATDKLKALGHKVPNWGENNLTPTMTHSVNCTVCKEQFAILDHNVTMCLVLVSIADVYSCGNTWTRPVITTIYSSTIDLNTDQFFFCARLKVFL